MINEETLNQELEESTEQTPDDTALAEQQPAQASTDDQAAKEASDREKNFRNLREKSERIQKERDEMAARLKALEDQAKKNERDPDDLVEARYVNEKIQQLEQKMYMTTTEARLKAELPDLESVVNEDTLRKLVELEPETAAVINSSSDFYNKAKAAYRAIKRSGIIKDETHKQERERVQNNANKPRPGVSVNPQVGDSPLSRANAFANGLTEDLKKQLYKEMIEARRKH